MFATLNIAKMIYILYEITTEMTYRRLFEKTVNTFNNPDIY